MLLYYAPVFTADGRASVVAQTKNTVVKPTTSTAAGKKSGSCADKEHGCRGNRTEEMAHREGTYTDTNISEDP
jgi:hypothetical protein